MGEQRKCQACLKTLPREEYCAREWNRGEGRSRCRKCRHELKKLIDKWGKEQVAVQREELETQHQIDKAQCRMLGIAPGTVDENWDKRDRLCWMNPDLKLPTKRHPRGRSTRHEKFLRAIEDLQGNQCLYCGKLLDATAHVDHFIPCAKGGSDQEENLVLACPPCNLDKKDKMPQEWSGWNGAYPVLMTL